MASFAAAEEGPRGLRLAMNAQDLVPINASFLYYRQPDEFSSVLWLWLGLGSWLWLGLGSTPM